MCEGSSCGDQKLAAGARRSRCATVPPQPRVEASLQISLLSLGRPRADGAADVRQVARRRLAQMHMTSKVMSND